MKVGDLVVFPCAFEKYQHRVGLLMGFYNNGEGIYGMLDTGSALEHPPHPSRRVADILYKGKMTICWAHNLQEWRD
jgi:hypothetical protein